MFEYVLKYGFYFFFSIVLMLVMGPMFYSMGKEASKPLENVETLNFSDYGGSKAYLIAEAITRTKNRYRERYYVPDKEYIKLENYLTKKESIHKKLVALVPLTLTKNELAQFKNIRVSGDNNDIIERLLINDIT